MITKKQQIRLVYSVRDLARIRAAIAEGFKAVWQGSKCVLTKIERVACSIWGWLCD